MFIVNVPTLTVTRGVDLSGFLQSAGGIGGLLAMTESSGANSYFHADALGNVTALMDASENIVARREFDAFGRTINLTGGKAGVNPFWFSSQLHDEDTDIYSYVRRPYSPTLQRWPNHDPIGERGGINLYGYVANNPVNYIDPLGENLGIPGASPGYGSMPTPQNIVPSDMQYRPDPNIEKARQWLRKCHPEIAPGTVIESSFLYAITAPGGDPWLGFGVPWTHRFGGVVFIAPNLGLDTDVNILAHEGIHTVEGLAFREQTHNAVRERARDIEMEFWTDPEGKKCDKCKK